MRRTVGWLAIVLVSGPRRDPRRVGEPGRVARVASPDRVAVAGPSSSLAAGPSASPGASPVALSGPCDLWTAEEVSAAWAVASSPSTRASSGARPAGTWARRRRATSRRTWASASPSATHRRDRSWTWSARTSRTPRSSTWAASIAIPGSTYPGAGKAKGWSMATLYLFPDPMIMVQLQATAPKGVDAAAALVSLATLAAPRIATIQPPTASPSPSASPGASGGPSPSSEPRDGTRGAVPDRDRRRPDLDRPGADGPGVPVAGHQLQADGAEGDQGAPAARQEGRGPAASSSGGTQTRDRVIAAFQVKGATDQAPRQRAAGVAGHAADRPGRASGGRRGQGCLRGHGWLPDRRLRASPIPRTTCCGSSSRSRRSRRRSSRSCRELMPPWRSPTGRGGV